MMPIYTDKLSLVKPSNTELVDIEDLNPNWDLIDAKLGSVLYVDERKTTTCTLVTNSTTSKTVSWFVRRYNDGRMEIESDPVTCTIPITTAWADGLVRSDSSIQWVFPYSFTSQNTYECKAVETNQLCFEVPVLNTTTWLSSRTMSGWKTYLFYAAPDSKTATIKIRCRVTGKWK